MQAMYVSQVVPTVGIYRLFPVTVTKEVFIFRAAFKTITLHLLFGLLLNVKVLRSHIDRFMC